MIIGISGNINSGKDTVASILVYLYAVGKHKATFKYTEVKYICLSTIKPY